MQTNNEQKTTKNYNNSYQKRYFRPRTISYVKRFETFEEGFSEVIKFNPELKNYCGRDPIIINVITTMLNSIKDNIPTTDNSNYPNTLSLSIDAKEVGFKTDINIAIGWRTEYFFKEGKTYYNFRISFFRIPSYKKSIIDEMVQSGWKKIERNNYYSHFWDKTSDKLRKKHKFNSNYQKINTIPKDKQESIDLLPESDNEVIETTTPEFDNETEVVGNIPESHFHNNIPKSSNDNTDENISEIENKIKEETPKAIIEQTLEFSKDSVVKSPVNGTYIITHNNKTNVININDPENENNLGIIIDRENKTATYPDGTVFNLNF